MNKYFRIKIPFVKIIILGALIFQLVYYFIAWNIIFRSPLLKYNDFTVFYLAGRIARSGQFSQLFNYEFQYHLFERLVAGDPNSLPSVQVFQAMMPEHPPFYVPIYALFALDNYYTAYALYSCFILLLLILCAVIIYRFLSDNGWGKQNAVLASLCAICFYPAAIILIKGHDMIYVLLGFLLWMTGLLIPNEKRAGIGLALGTVAPQISGIIALPLIASRRKAAVWFCITCGVLVAFSLILVGKQGLLDFIDLFRVFMQGPKYIAIQLNMFNFLGIIRRSFPELNYQSAGLLSWIAAFIIVGWLCWYWWKKGIHMTASGIGMTVLLGLFFAPHLHFHNLSLLILPWLTLAIHWGIQGERGQVASLSMLTVFSLLMLFGDLIPDPWRFYFAYLIIGILAFGLINSMKPGMEREL